MEQKKHFSLRELQLAVRERLAEAFPLPVWVAAEISEMKVNYSGHCYLELVEKGGANGVPAAKASAVIWRSHYGPLASYFASKTGERLAVGMKVLVRVTISYHELYGLSFQIQDIDPTYTLGDWEQQRQQTIARLREEGVWDMNRELGMPRVPQRVAIVSSANAAGYQDFCKEIARSPYRVELTLFDAFMQGHGAEDSIIEALERVADRADEFDVVAVIRGGGSQSDLACFNSYRLCANVAQFPLPVVTGIGHDKDESVADMVAAQRLKTPTAVAAWINDQLADFDGALEALSEAVERCATEFLASERQRLERNAAMIATQSVGATRRLELTLERYRSELRRAVEKLLSDERNRVARADENLRRVTDYFVHSERDRLGALAQAVAAHDPQRIMALGFAVVSVDGHAVSDAQQIAIGTEVSVRLAKGKLKAKVTDNGKND
ncbi:MAG: exodeoxyribonuclease VII large subunit [Rikenellaceae bacterium]|nr:exodeoxyribonuclease VII large subunit [Rikenellaceae bacterium]MBR3801622.1 exodeoxyribonuclease VII large subunit [Rikenellaceae bacterium]